MRERDNYFAEIERPPAKVLRSVRHTTGPLSQRGILDIAAQLGFTLHYVTDLPGSTRSVTDLRNRRIYLPQVASGKGHDPRAVVLQTLGHFVLGHEDPADYGDFLRQRVEANYFAAALLMPEKFAVDFLREAKADRALAIDDFRDAFGVSYETAAHRFTNLATHHFGIPVHFTRVHESGVGLQGVRERRRALPGRRDRRDRGAADRAAGGPRGRCSRPRTRTRRSTSSPTRRPAPTGARCTWSRPASGEFSVTVGHAVRARPLVPRRRHDPAHRLALPRPGLLPAAAGRPGGPVGRARLAERAGALAPAGGAAAGHVPRRRRAGRLRVPAAARRRRRVAPGRPAGIEKLHSVSLLLTLFNLCWANSRRSVHQSEDVDTSGGDAPALSHGRPGRPHPGLPSPMKRRAS